MQICEYYPENWHGSNVVARFSVRLHDDLKLVGLKLHKKPDGSFRTRPPNINGKAAYHLGPDLAASITKAAAAVANGERTALAVYHN